MPGERVDRYQSVRKDRGADVEGVDGIVGIIGKGKRGGRSKGGRKNI